MSDLNVLKYQVCCPLCDKDKCVRGTSECDAEKWEKEKEAGVLFMFGKIPESYKEEGEKNERNCY